MAGTQVQRRRGSTAEHASFTGAAGELTVDVTKKTVVVHDGVTTGGIPLAREDAIADASTTAKGIVELATDAEVQAGADATRAVTPAGLAACTSTDTRAGVVELATNAEVQAGADTARAVTPAGLASLTATDTRAGLIELATTAEAQAGSDSTRGLTPLRLREGLNAAGSAPIYACRAWVNFNGTGTVAIRASGNVSSVTDNGTGDYTVNFTTAMADTNYCVDGSSSVPTLGSADTRCGVLTVMQVATGNVRVITAQNSDNGAAPAYKDCPMNSVAIFR